MAELELKRVGVNVTEDNTGVCTLPNKCILLEANKL
jgi:hypothetical protein